MKGLTKHTVFEQEAWVQEQCLPTYTSSTTDDDANLSHYCFKSSNFTGTNDDNAYTVP